MYKANLKTKPTCNQVLTGEAKHTFQWSRGTATCSCGWWTLWGASLESAKRNYALHRANMLRIEGYEQDHIGKRSLQTEQRKLVAVDGKG
jgi:hypothetical protein